MKSYKNLKNSIRSLFVFATLAVITCLSFAGPVNRAYNTVNIKAGVVVINSDQIVAGEPADQAPFEWYAVDQQPLIKPSGWNFYNPYAQSTVTQAIQTRATALGYSNVPALGTQLTKNMAMYWEAPLDQLTDAQLSNYDVLVMPVYGLLSLNPSERAKLERFMDQGGVLWVDTDSTTTVDAANSTPISIALSSVHAYSNLPPQVDSFAPPMSYPYTLPQVPVGDPGYSNGTGILDLIQPNLASAGLGALQSLLETVGPDFSQLIPFENSSSTGNALAMYAHVGNGAIVVTSRGSALPLGYSTSFYYQIPATGINYNAVKFAVNIAYLSDGFSQQAQGSRKTSSSPIDIKAPLLQTFKADVYSGVSPLTGSPAPFSPPVEYKGLVFVGSGNYLYAFSANPGSDLYHSGNPDDGIQDYSLGKGYDLVWQSTQLQGPLSSPVAYTVTNNGVTVDEVAVVDGAGNLDTFAAFPPLVPVANLTAVPILKAYSPPTGAPIGYSYSSPPFAPTYFNGLIYISDNVSGVNSNGGRLWVVDPATQSNVNSWCLGAPGNTFIPAISGPPTVGYIPIFDNTGGQDLVVYLPLQAVTGGISQTCGVTSIWAGAKGEKHDLEVNSANQLVVPTRASQVGLTVYDPGGADPHGIRLSLVDQTGQPVPATQMANYFTGNVTQSNGVLTFDLKPGVTVGTLNSAGIFSDSIDYWIDWNSSNSSIRSTVRGSIELPDDSSNSKQVLDNIAMGSNGYIYVVESNPNEGISDGSFFTLQEYGRGGFKVLSRFDLYPAFSLNLSGFSNAVKYPATLGDNDPVQGFAPKFLAGPFSQLNFVSGPAVRGNYVYVKARGYKTGFNVPCSILMAFSANPPSPSFTVPGTLQPGFTLVQPDISRTTFANKTQPDTFTQVMSNNGQITTEASGGGTQITLNNLASNLSGSVQPLSESLPVIVRQSGRPDEVVQPDLTGNWSTLQWYTVVHGMDDGPITSEGFNFDTGDPIVTGDTLFFGGNSITPQILSGISPIGAKPSGELFAMTAQVSPGDPYLFSDANRPWFKQLDLLSIPSIGTISVNPDILWPQSTGITNFTQYRQRLLQSTLGGQDLKNQRLLFGISAGDGNLFAYGNTGLYGYTHANFTVADSNRVATFDPAGNTLWSTDQLVTSALNGAYPDPGENTSSAARVTRAYPVTSSSWLMTEPGANRVVEVDKSGQELEDIKGFTVDPNFVPNGFNAGEPLTLSQPQDAITYTDYHLAANNPFSNAQPMEKWVHFMIADTGNHRLIEIVDRYKIDPTTHIVLSLVASHELLYHSPAQYSGKGFGYTSISRVFSPYSQQYVFAAAISAQTHSRSSLGLDVPTADPTTGLISPQIHGSGAGNGSILIIDGAKSQVIDSVVVPQIAAGVIRDPATGLYNAVGSPQYTMSLGNINSATLATYFNTQTNATEIRLMFTNQNGVYEVVQDPVTGNWDVVWMLPTGAFECMRTNLITNSLLPTNPQGFFPTYAKRTSEGTVIVVNGYVGETTGLAPYGGEVLELEGNTATVPIPTGFSFSSPNFGFNSLSIRFDLPSVQGGRGIQAPVFADRK